MISMALKYSRFPILRLSAKIKLNIPDKWDECRERHLRALLYSSSDGATDVRFISMYTGINERIVRKMNKFFQFQIIDKIEAVAKSPFTGIFYIKEIDCVKEKLFAPGERMHGVTFGQFIFFDAYYNDNEEESVNKFITHLYLPKDEKFDEEKCLARAKKLNIDEATKEAIMFNYGMFYGYFEKAFPLLFAPAEGGKGKGGYDPRGWIKVYESVVGNDIVNSDKYAEMPLTTMFRFLTENIKKAVKGKKTNVNG